MHVRVDMESNKAADRAADMMMMMMMIVSLLVALRGHVEPARILTGFRVPSS